MSNDNNEAELLNENLLDEVEALIKEGYENILAVLCSHHDEALNDKELVRIVKDDVSAILKISRPTFNKLFDSGLGTFCFVPYISADVLFKLMQATGQFHSVLDRWILILAKQVPLKHATKGDSLYVFNKEEIEESVNHCDKKIVQPYLKCLADDAPVRTWLDSAEAKKERENAFKVLGGLLKGYATLNKMGSAAFAEKIYDIQPPTKPTMGRLYSGNLACNFHYFLAGCDYIASQEVSGA